MKKQLILTILFSLFFVKEVTAQTTEVFTYDTIELYKGIEVLGKSSEKTLIEVTELKITFKFEDGRQVPLSVVKVLPTELKFSFKWSTYLCLDLGGNRVAVRVRQDGHMIILMVSKEQGIMFFNEDKTKRI